MNNYFCVLPYFSYELNMAHKGNMYCCKLAPGADIAEIRKSIQNKQRAPECSECWKLEDSGLPSERIIHNSTFDYLIDRDIDKIEEDAIAGQHSSKIIKLHTSNICNGTCVTCGSKTSSAWAALENDNRFPYKIAPDTKLDHLNWAEIVQLSFVGGEPLLEKKNLEILKHLIEVNNTDCFISFVTNGSIELSDAQRSLLSQFKNLNICLSIDGVGPVFEYMRYPLSWDKLINNLKFFKSITSEVSVSCMISNLNVLYYSNLLDFFKQENLKYICRPITMPECFNPNNLPKYVKEKILLANTKYHHEVAHFLNDPSSTATIDELFLEVSRQDKLKNININDYLPGFIELFKDI